MTDASGSVVLKKKNVPKKKPPTSARELFEQAPDEVRKFFKELGRLRGKKGASLGGKAAAAGALRKPTFTITPYHREWRWLEFSRADSPWYPTMKLFRQPAPGDWAGAVAQVAEAVRERAARH